jgi:predicted nucleic acid-binding protein
MRLVVDTGPLIALSKTGHLDLPCRLFDEVVVPATVLAEIAPPGETRPGAEIRHRSWMVIRSVSPATRVELQTSHDIAAGEAEAILITADTCTTRRTVSGRCRQRPYRTRQPPQPR